MSDRRDFVLRLAAMTVVPPATRLAAARTVTPDRERQYWVKLAAKLAEPVLGNLAAGRLRQAMPVELSAAAGADRRDYAHLEATGRLLAGIAPWLELGAADSAEGRLRARYAELARRGLDFATNPASPDFQNFTRGRQPLVDAAFLAHAVVRAPHELWEKVEPRVRRQLVTALVSTRAIQPPENNWLLFAAMIEAALSAMGEPWERQRVDHAMQQHQRWYKGDGVYGDGPTFHWDYYNSYVIQPMLLDVVRTLSRVTNEWQAMEPDIVARAQRYAAIQERLISPEGTFPPIGRSLVYRCGAFQLLGQMALRHQLPAPLPPAQVRGAMGAVIRRTMDAHGTFDPRGWLTVGLSGRQPHLGEGYISNGSAYLCSVALLPLGLPPDDPFWTAPQRDWTQKSIWSGHDAAPDHAL